MKLKLFLAVVAVSVVFGFYPLILSRRLGPDYSPITINSLASPLIMDETIAYAAKVREILDGQWRLSDLYLWENKQQPSPLLGEILPAYVVAGLARLTGSIGQAFSAADLIFPAINFLLLTRLVYLLFPQTAMSALISLGVMFFSHYFSSLPFIPSIIKLLIANLNNGSYSQFLRAFHPQLTMPIFLIFTIALYRRRWLILGLSLGLMFYSYLFFWPLSWLWLIIYARKDWKKLIFSLGLGFLIGLPYLINMAQFYFSELSRDYSANFQFFAGGEARYFLFLILPWLTTAWWLKKSKLILFWRSFWLAGIILGSIISLLHFNVDNMLGHWLLRIFYPYLFIWLALGICLRIKKLNNRWLWVMIFLLLVYQFRVHWQYFTNNQNMFILPKEKTQLFTYLNQNTPIDSVVLTAGLTDNLLLTVFTHNNVFIPQAYLSLATDADRSQRFLLANKLAGVPETQIAASLSLTEENQTLKAKKRFNFDNCAGHYLYFRRFIGADYYNCSVSNTQQDILLNRYRELQPDWNVLKLNYRIDYWLFGPYENQWATIDPIDFDWQLIWSNSSYQLFAPTR